MTEAMTKLPEDAKLVEDLREEAEQRGWPHSELFNKAANALVAANSRIAELREAAKGQLVVVNAANARAEAAEARVTVLEKAGRTLSTLLHDLEKGGVELTEYADEIWARATEVIDRAALSTGAGEEKR
jgi:hypothetical protein